MSFRHLIPLLFWLLQPALASAQTAYEERRTELQQQQEATRMEIQRIEEQMETYRNRIQLATRRYEEMFRQYEELTRLIILQEEQIRKMEQEQRQIRAELELVEENLSSLETELNRLVERYQKTLIYLYKHGKTNELALLLTSSSFNQLLVRAYYLSRFDHYREEQEAQIRARQEEYSRVRDELEETERRNIESLARIEQEREEMREREEQQARNIELLQRDRQQLEEQLARTEEQHRLLDETLTELAEEEERMRAAEEERLRRLAAARQIEDDAERAAALARYSRPIARVAAVSEEELTAYESSFQRSRGGLPWPVEGGTITERFGERVHPVFRTRTSHPGIDIAVRSRSPVQVVHDGYVFAVQPFTGFGNVIMVHHGRYKTVYGNLSDVFVSRGQVLKSGDVIGLSGDENSIRGEVLFFMIRDGSNNVNPESWIRKSP